MSKCPSGRYWTLNWSWSFSFSVWMWINGYLSWQPVDSLWDNDTDWSKMMNAALPCKALWMNKKAPYKQSISGFTFESSAWYLLPIKEPCHCCDFLLMDAQNSGSKLKIIKGQATPGERQRRDGGVDVPNTFQTSKCHGNYFPLVYLLYLYSVCNKTRTYLTESQSLTPTFSGRRLTWINPPPPTVDNSNRHMHHTCKCIP